MIKEELGESNEAEEQAREGESRAAPPEADREREKAPEHLTGCGLPAAGGKSAQSR